MVVTMTWVVTRLPSDNVVVMTEEDTREGGGETDVDDSEEVGVGVGVGCEDWEVKILLEILVLLVNAGLELHDVENKVRVGFELVNVTGTVKVTGTVFVDAEAGEQTS